MKASQQHSLISGICVLGGLAILIGVAFSMHPWLGCCSVALLLIFFGYCANECRKEAVEKEEEE